MQRCAPSVFQGVVPIQGNFEDAQAVKHVTRLAFRNDRDLQVALMLFLRHCMSGLLSPYTCRVV